MKTYKVYIHDLSNNSFIDWSNAEKKEHLEFWINTNGGSCPVTLNVYSRMMSERRDIITRSFGEVQSAGILLFSAGRERIASKNDYFMIHGVQLTLNQNKPFGEVQSMLDNFITFDTILAKRLGKISKKSYTYWRDLIFSQKDHHLTGNEMYKLGVVTKLI